MPSTPPSRTLVLVGGGHAHVHVLKSFGERPEPGVEVVLVARDLKTAYSGMLPGHIEGHYDYETCHIDLVRLSRATGASLVHAEAVGLDPDRRLVILRDLPPHPYDLLSLDIGSTPALEAEGAREHALPVKPVEDFLGAWRALVQEVERTGVAPRIAVVGGGAGGVEATLAIHARLSRALAAAGRPGAPVTIALATRHGLLEKFNSRARLMLEQELSMRKIEALTDARIVRVERQELVAADGRRVPFDRAFWLTWAAAAEWLGETGLALDQRGFVAVDAALRSVSHPEVFAAGDVATVLPHPREKAGVYAVRQGQPLADNLRRALRGEAPQPFIPQARALALIGTGERRAVAVWGPLALRASWIWWWKERIDRRWMRRYQDIRPLPGAARGG